MKIGVLGTGRVGETIASKLVSLGHEVCMGSRTTGNDKAVAWAQKAGAKASQGSFSDAAAFGECLFNCTSGEHSLAVLKSIGAEKLSGKVLFDLANPLTRADGQMALTVANTDSLAETLQRAFPALKVVKTLNTVNCDVMVNPGLVASGEHDIFVAGNDAAARAFVAQSLTQWFGWKHVVDLGDLTAARALESYLLLWARMWGQFKTSVFGVRFVR